MKLKTTDLQDAVTRVSRGAGNNKLIPLTSLIDVMLSDNVLFLTTTDATNYFTVKVDNVEGEDFEVSVNADVFTKLVQKMTSEFISMEVAENYLLVVGNGKYKIELLLDETGSPVKFPEADGGEQTGEGTFALSDVKKIILNNKASLSVDNSVPCLMNYYCGKDAVISTDRYKICRTIATLFDTPYLISPSVMEMLSLFTDKDVKYYIQEKAIVFDSSKEFLYAPYVDGVEKMPITAIEGLLSGEFESSCKLSKASLLAVLDRLNLFVTPYDKNTIYLTFTEKGLEITSKKSSGAEVVAYENTDLNPFNTYTCAIDIEMLRSQVTTVNSDVVEMYFGSDVAVKFVADDVVKIVALQADDRM